MENELYIILVNYNGWKDTIECVKSLRKNEKEYNIVIVDNFSKDKSIEKLEQLQNNKTIIIESKDNLGFAGGNNIGIDYALKKGAKYIMLLNNDTEIEKDAISNMKEKMDKDVSLGVVGSRIMYYDDRDIINYCGGHFNWFKGITVHENYKKRFNYDKEFFYTEFVTGCSMLIRREVFEKVGLLPEEYFMYYEDADFCVKVKEGGYKLGVCVNSIIYHKVSKASGGEDSLFSIEWMTKNRLYFIRKYKKYTKGILTLWFVIITRYMKIVKYYIFGNKEKAKIIKKGLKDGLALYKKGSL